MSEVRLVKGPGSRQLGVAESGDPEGMPVVMFHGTPGALIDRMPNDPEVRAAGIRLITYDRPGYGDSDRHPGRRVVDCVADVAAIADALGVDQFHAIGGSGGGPHVLALAARLGDRVLAAEAFVSIAPADAAGLDFYDGMDPENIKELGWARDGEATLHRNLTAEAAGILERFATDPANPLGDFDLDEADRALLAREDIQQLFGDQMRQAFKAGVWGWVDDDLAFLAPWGFDLAEITVPVVVRYGSKDVVVPAGHGRWLGQQVPGARVVVNDDAGHLASPEDMFAALVELTRTTAGNAP